MILSYKEYITDEEILSDQGKVSSPILNNPELFYSERGLCPHCKIKADQVYKHRYDRTYQYGEGPTGDVKVWQCKICGWWEIKESNNFQFPDANEGKERLFHSILKKFDDESVEMPILELRKELRKNTNILHSIHPTALERLVQSVFRDFYECEVEHCGRSNDGGIDLIVVNSDSPILVQVKRRENSNKSEPVSSVREFLGASMLKQGKECIFVTTAKSYSPQAIGAANVSLKLGLVNKYELIHKERLLEMLSLVENKDINYWKPIIDLWVNNNQA